ncbi:hypothetical protein LCGC14_2248850 [marine sediment metagenome]|uniref:Uncharacterized protein n=1 Tax=marine sediment metagenome TaxID=412755 RepID=A0A0F9D3G6_9ZZZZ
MPTNKQLELYKLIHPDYAGFTLVEAADILGIHLRSAQQRVANMRKTHPQAFDYEKFIKKEEENIYDIQAIYKGYLSQAKVKDIEWNLTIEELEAIIQLDCHVCGKYNKINLGNTPGFHANSSIRRTAYNHKTGQKFAYHRLWRFDVTKGYDYVNCVSICWRCIRRRRLHA